MSDIGDDLRAWWTVERTQNARFPFRIAIVQQGRTLHAVRARDAWPGAGSQVFCLRERELDPAENLDEIERVPVAHIARLGRKLSVTLDRAQRKRCEFLTIAKPRSDGGTFEQVFFRTEAAVRAHKSRKRVELGAATARLDITIDSAERYPWSFAGASMVRRRLPVGDYALMHEDRPVAIVERKTLPNLLTDFAELKGLHQQLAELNAWPHAALVIEAQYADFGDARKIGPWPAAFLLRALAELPVLFPSVQCVYAGNRKLANVWAGRWFAAVAAKLARPSGAEVNEVLARYTTVPADGGVDERIRLEVIQQLPDRFEFAQLRECFPGIADARLRAVLTRLRSEGRLSLEGAGRGARWIRVQPDQAPSA